MIVSCLKGRLGNKMFCICAAKKIANDLGYEFGGAFVYEQTRGEFNENSISDYEKNTILRKVKILDYKDYIGNPNFLIYPKNPNDYVSSNFSIPKRDNLILNAFFQDVKYIDKDIAYKLFEPYNSIKEEINNLYGDLSNYVCVHVRRGDYLSLSGSGFRVLNKQYIEKCLNKYFNGCQVMFVSDDINWCKQNFIGDRYHFTDKKCKNSEEMDLYIQTQCGIGNIISNSTFSWWGAYLNTNENKKVIVPYPWFKNNFLGGLNNIMPNDWIKEECL